MTERNRACSSPPIAILCTCPKTDCPRHGLCCACVRSHRDREHEPTIKRLPHCLRFLVADPSA